MIVLLVIVMTDKIPFALDIFDRLSIEKMWSQKSNLTLYDGLVNVP